MEFNLRHQKYDWRHFYLIPFQCAPISTIAVTVQKLLTGLSAVFQVTVTAKFIDMSLLVAQGEAELSEVVPWLVLLIVLVGWRRVSYNIGRIFTARISLRSEQQLSKAFTDKRARMKYSYVESPEIWDLVNRVCGDISYTIKEMIQRALNFILYLIRIFGVLYIVFTQIWWVGVLVLVLIVPLIFVSVKSGGTNYNARKEAAKYERRHKYLSETMSSREAADERTMFGFSNFLNEQWGEHYEQARKIWLKAETKNALSINIGSSITTILSSIITVALVFPAVNGQITYGMFIAIAAAVYDLVKLMGWEMTKAATQLSRFNEYLKEFTKFANLEEDDEAINKPEPPQVFDSLEFRNVSFKYPGVKAYVLNNMSLRIENGMHYAFVGANGSGKTTLTKLITGLYDNYEGEILLNGKSLREYNKAQLKGMFAGVYQDFAKYYVSVANNILIGDINNIERNDTRERMEEAAKHMDIYEKLNGLPKGFDTPLGKIEGGGVDVSGGQWQRIAMARALMSPAPVRILDEPTSALDPISESKMYESFEAISQGISTIFISHRLGSTKIADKIFVIANGSVAEEGSHEELMMKDGIYADMYESQRSWYL